MRFHARVPLIVFALAAPLCAGEAYVHQGTIDRVAQPMGVLFDNDGSLLIAAGAFGLIRVDLSQPNASMTRVSEQPSIMLSSGTLALTSDGKTLTAIDASRPIPAGVPATATAITTNDKEIAWCVRDEDRIFKMSFSGGEPTSVIGAPNGWLAPESLAFAPDGSLWVADTGHSRVVCVATNGKIFTSGERGFFPGQFIEPFSIAFDQGGPLVSDRLGHRITRLDWLGALRDVFGLHSIRPREGKGKIHYPTAIATDPKTGRVAVCEGFERRVQVFRPLTNGEQPPPRPPIPNREGVSSHFGIDVSACDSLVAAWEPESGTVVLWDTRSDPPIYVTTLGGNGDQPGRFIRPVSVLVSADGMHIWVLDALADRVEHWILHRDLNSSIIFDAFMANMLQSIDLAQVRSVAGIQNSRPVDLIAIGGSLERGTSTTVGQGVGIVFANGDVVWVDSFGADSILDSRPSLSNISGHVIAAAFDKDTNEIILLWPNIIERRSLQSASQLQLPAEIISPRGIAAAPNGEMILSDSSHDTVVQINAQGKITRRFGAPERDSAALFDGIAAAKDGALWLPAGVDTGAKNCVYVVDYGNHRLQRFGLDGAWQSTFTLSKSRAALPSPATEKPQASEEAKVVADRQARVSLLKSGEGICALNSGATLRWKALEPIVRAEPFSLEITVTDKDNHPLEGFQLRVDAQMPHHNHGMNLIPKITQLGPGKWRADPLLFHMPGRWELMFDLKQDGRVTRAQTTLELE